MMEKSQVKSGPPKSPNLTVCRVSHPNFDTRIQFFKEDFEENIQHGMKIVEKFLNESETQLQEFRDPL